MTYIHSKTNLIWGGFLTGKYDSTPTCGREVITVSQVSTLVQMSVNFSIDVSRRSPLPMSLVYQGLTQSKRDLV